MRESSAERELWVEKTGAFFPLVVAAQAQSRLPFAGALIPTEEDLARSLVWLPVIGACLGILWAFLGAACFELGLDRLTTAVFVVGTMIALGGLYFEHALSRTVARNLARWRGAQQSDDGEDRLLAAVATVTLAIVLRLACVAALSPEDYTASLIGAAVLSRWALSLVPLFCPSGEARDTDGWVRYLAVGAVVAVVMVLCAGGMGLFMMIVAGGLMGLYAKRIWEGERDLGGSEGMARAAPLAFLIEIAVLL